MKTYEEKAAIVLSRIAKERDMRINRQKNIIRIAVPVMSLVFILAIGVGVWRIGLSGNYKTPESGLDMAADMIGALVYKGKIYRQSNAYFSGTPEYSVIEQLLGEYVGEAKGNLGCFSAQDEWEKELASTYAGSVYTVKGYSEDFRLCICVSGYDRDMLQFVDDYGYSDGYAGLNMGADLFEERFHIIGNVESVTYLTHDDWNEGNGNYKELSDVSREQLDDFLYELCENPIVRIDHINNRGFYDAKIQGHLYLNMKDGTYVELRMMDGGYVGCQNLGWIFVKMPGEIFDTVMDACQ